MVRRDKIERSSPTLKLWINILSMLLGISRRAIQATKVQPFRFYSPFKLSSGYYGFPLFLPNIGALKGAAPKESRIPRHGTVHTRKFRP